MKPQFLSRNLQRIANFAQSNGTIAVVDGDAVTVITPIVRRISDGMRSVNFKVDRVRSMDDIHKVLDAAFFKWRLPFISLSQ